MANGMIDAYRKTLASNDFLGLYKRLYYHILHWDIHLWWLLFGFYETLNSLIFLRENASTFASFCFGIVLQSALDLGLPM